MDIAGAKALKRRLGSNGADEDPLARADVDVAEDAPPVYHWLGVEKAALAFPARDEDAAATPGFSLFRRLGLSFR